MFALSLEHIKRFRAHAETHPVFDIVATLLSQIGDKFGLFGAMSISHHFNNEANSFINGV